MWRSFGDAIHDWRCGEQVSQHAKWPLCSAHDTSRSRKHVGDEYFLTSGDKVRFFFEEDAVQDGVLDRPKELAVNKMGHGRFYSKKPYLMLLITI